DDGPIHTRKFQLQCRSDPVIEIFGHGGAALDRDVLILHVGNVLANNAVGTDLFRHDVRRGASTGSRVDPACGNSIEFDCIGARELAGPVCCYWHGCLYFHYLLWNSSRTIALLSLMRSANLSNTRN